MTAWRGLRLDHLAIDEWSAWCEWCQTRCGRSYFCGCCNRVADNAKEE